MLKVEKSDLGALFWTHGEELVNDKDPHYTFLNADKTELEIVTASPEQAGIYEILLKEGGCEIRKIIEVQLYGEGLSLSVVVVVVVVLVVAFVLVSDKGESLILDITSFIAEAFGVSKINFKI